MILTVKNYVGTHAIRVKEVDTAIFITQHDYNNFLHFYNFIKNAAMDNNEICKRASLLASAAVRSAAIAAEKNGDARAES
jgi:hypothetical protein